MNQVLSAAAPLSTDSTSSGTILTKRVAWIFAFLTCALMFFANGFRREGFTGDEGFYGVTALNMLQAPEYLLRPSYFPAGDFATDRDGFAHPPFNSYFYAAALWFARGSLLGPEVLNALNFALLLFLVHRLITLADRRAATVGVLLLAASAPMVGYYGMLEAEPLMTTFGLAGIYCCLRGTPLPGQRWWWFAGGLGLGMAFAFKLWLCAPLGLAAVVAVVARGFQANWRWSGYLLAGALLASGFVMPAASHLAAVAIYYPQDLGFWLNNIYFGVFTQAGISGDKLGGSATPSGWVHPIWYYGPALYRDHFFLVPAVAFGAVALWRDRLLRGTVLLVAIAGAIGVAPLSILKVKEPLYVLACALFLYVIAALCVAALIRRFATRRGLDAVSRWGGGSITVGMLLLVPLAYLRGIKPDDVTLPFVVAHSAAIAAWIATMAWAHARRSARVLEFGTLVACGVAMVASFGWKAARQHPVDAAVAQVVAPYVREASPTAVAMIASNFKSHQLYTFRKAMYWHDLPVGAEPASVLAAPAFARVKAFVLDRRDQERAENAPWVAWLEGNAVEKTDELNGQIGETSGYRVFVRD